MLVWISKGFTLSSLNSLFRILHCSPENVYLLFWLYWCYIFKLGLLYLQSFKGSGLRVIVHNHISYFLMSWCVLHWESYVKLFGIQLQEYLFFFCCPLYFLLHIGGFGYIEIHMLYVYCEFWLNSFTKLYLTVDCSGPISPSPCGLFYKNIFLLWKFKALFCFFFFSSSDHPIIYVFHFSHFWSDSLRI